jgi:glutamate-1-semialdehyde 2,1-aminomutase
MFRKKPRNPREHELLERTGELLPAAVCGVTARPADAMVAAGGSGARIRDLSGNEYVDYLLGSGALLLGHAHPAVVAAVGDVVAKGAGNLLVNEHALELADEIVRAVPCAERVVFHSSGSEAVACAVRVARAFRGRDKILKFEGGFHGMSDYALLSNQWLGEATGSEVAVPVSAGIPRAVVEQVYVAPFNDLAAAVAAIERHHDELAAVIVEPLERTFVPVPGFLQGLRDATRRRGILLIFDEVVTSFRLAYGGAQERYGVAPDLCAIGKSISSGFPFAATCGRADLLALLDPARRGRGDYVAYTGTYSGNSVSTAAALAAVRELKRPGTYERLYEIGVRLMDGLRDALRSAGVPAQLVGEPPAFEVWFSRDPVVDFRSSLAADRARHARFTELLLERGVLKAHEKFFVSTALTDADVDFTLGAFRDAAAALGRELHA